MTRNRIQLQAKGSKLQQKRLHKNLKYAKTTKHGLTLEQKERKVDGTIPSRERPEDTRVMALKEEIRQLGKQRELKRTGVIR